jgi:hypothetical protein
VTVAVKKERIRSSSQEHLDSSQLPITIMAIFGLWVVSLSILSPPQADTQPYRLSIKLEASFTSATLEVDTQSSGPDVN